MELSIWDTCYRKHNSTTNVDIRICRHSKPCMNMIKKIRFDIFHLRGPAGLITCYLP